MSRWSRRSRSAAVLAAGVSAVLAAAAPASSAAEEWAWPVRGSVITPYSNDNSRPYAGGMHRGIDISASVGASVAAARAGKVTYAGALGSSGLTLAIETADARYVTSYLHLSSVAVKRGESVGTGQKVGEVGTSGQRSAAEPHLHFGVRLAGREHSYVDPLTLLPPLTGGKPEAPASAAPLPAPLRAHVAPVPAGARPVTAVSLPRPLAAPVSTPRLPVRNRSRQREPLRAPGPSSVPELSRTPEPLRAPEALRAPAHPTRGYAHGRPVPAGPNPSHSQSPGRKAPGAPENSGRGLAVREGSPINWGPLVSLAGILLLGAVLARRLLRHDHSGASRGENRAQPSTRTAAVDVSQLGSVSQMG